MVNSRYIRAFKLRVGTKILETEDNILTLSGKELLVLAANGLDTDQARQNISKLYDALMVSLKEFFVKVNF